MRAFLPLAQFLLVLLIVGWDVVLTGRIAQVKNLPRPFVLLTGLAGFLLIPALVIHLATSSAITGRAVTSVDWLWPVTVVLFALQALYAASRRLVNPFLGFFMAAYDVIIAVDAVLRFVASRGTPLPGAALLFLAATSGAFAWITQSPSIIGSPFFFFVPMTAPAFPALRPSARTFRLALAVVAAGWIVVIFTQLTPADKAINSYGIHDSRTEKLQERPDGDFDIGIKIFPDLSSGPPPLALKNDLALADTLGVTVVNVVMVPEAMDRAALDSLAHTLESLRSDSTLLVVTMGYPARAFSLPGRTFSENKRLASIGPVVRRLRPDILLPAEDPYDSGTRAAGPRPPQFWEDFLTAAAREAKRANRRVRIGVSASSYDRQDSTLYAWAAAKGSPIDVVGFSLFPSSTGVRTLDAERGAADRWMHGSGSTKDHWVFATGGFPEAHGEASQERAVWAALAWATSRPVIKGLIVSEAGDYGTIRGIRAADGHLRRVTFALMRAMRGLRESAGESAPPALRAPQTRVGT
ncbi:MAG: hypothetical protein H0W68_09470 [Gemmatimonadaceae bacterium]|nr:hypothetical protein [Gemmatimonadaceae bacterium]